MQEKQLIKFLLQAKRSTYAAQGDDASVTPLLAGSFQLEYQQGELFYRDHYFGMKYFIGQEVVEIDGKPQWSMVYSGGIISPHVSDQQIGQIYQFLREALLRGDEVYLFRGPRSYQAGDFLYTNQQQGEIQHFQGVECIYENDVLIYKLHYHGGLIK